jgi:hypothetical protein
MKNRVISFKEGLFANTSDVKFTTTGPEILLTLNCDLTFPHTDVVQSLALPMLMC